MQMDISLFLLDADHDAVQVLVLRLDIFLGPRNKHFPCLEDVARLVFVGNGNRYDIEFPEVLDEIAGPAHVEHLEQPLFRNIYAVLGATGTLGNPDGALSGRDGFPDILG